jgi:hypothetical protein
MTNKWRTTSFVSLLFVFGIIFAFSSSSSAYQQPGTHAAPPTTRTPAVTPGAKAAKETYSVVSVGDEIKAVSSAEKLALTKKLKEDYKLELKKYTDAKKDKKNPDSNSLKKPDEKDYIVKILKANFKSQEDAQKFADEEVQKRSKTGKKTASNNNW